MKHLEEYRRKRDFGSSPEPAGRSRAVGRRRLRYCVQRHHARRLHYDLRLELDGVLKSWAVPKGPSPEPGERRLAVEVEDHPLEYRTFEGRIPEGEYGAGRVAIWDEGFWQPEGDPRRDLERGRLSFVLHGRRLRGRWSLVRMKDRDPRGKPNWLLIRGRAAAGGVPERPAIGFVPPMLATLTPSAPSGDEWIHELKFDGYRILARIRGGEATLWSRSGKDWTRTFPETAAALARLKTSETLIDGELVAMDARGASDFQALQTALVRGATGSLVYQAFDLLWLDGEDLRGRPLLDRKKGLGSILGPARPEGRVRYTDHVAGSGSEFKKAACRFELEGIVSKRADAPYRSGRSDAWLKTKCRKEQEFVVGGFTDPAPGRPGLGALLLGYYRRPKELVYAGRVGTGFDTALLLELREWLARLEREESPFAEGPADSERKGVHWVKPVMVAQVKFSGWTAEGRLRHPSFAGVREDKPAAEVRRERPESVVAGVTISHPERVVYPGSGITKRDVAAHFERVAERMLPHVAGRPLSLLRCPDGLRKACFYQKHWEGERGGVRTVAIREKRGTVPYAVIDDARGLVTLIQNGVLEVHPWGARAGDVERPDRCTFDLDPSPERGWRDVVAAAREIRKLLERLDLRSFVMTTGGKGLHVVVPFDPGPGWEELRAFAKGLATAMALHAPERYTATLSKSARRGKLFIDWLRNGRGATAVAAYSTRARAGAPVAAPLTWEELGGLAGPGAVTLRNLPGRLEGRDPWAGYAETRQSLPGRA